MEFCINVITQYKAFYLGAPTYVFKMYSCLAMSWHFTLWLINYPSSGGEYLGYLHLLALTNNAAMNTHGQAFLMWTSNFNFLGCLPRSKIAGSYSNIVEIVKDTFRLLTSGKCHFTFQPAVHEDDNFPVR